MKKSFVILLSSLFFLIFCIGTMASALSPGLDVIAHEKKLTVSAVSGEETVFSEKQFQEVAGNAVYSEMKIVSTPKESEGTLYFYDSPVTENRVIPISEAANLKFVPENGTKSSSFEFTFDGNYLMTCSIDYTDKVNNAPVSGGDITVNVFSGAVCGGTLTAEDIDCDKLTFDICDYPQNGKLKLDASTGEFRYYPENGSENDSFTYKVSDNKGAFSEKATVTFNVLRNETGISFCDMKEDVCATAAIMMADKGIMTYSSDGDKMTFSPGENVSRLDFLVSAMNVFGAGNIPTVKNTGFADDDKIPAEYKGYVYSAAKLGIIKGIEKNGVLYFCPDKAVTFAEASQIINNVIGYKPEKKDEKAPSWAKEAVSAMAELGICRRNDVSECMSKGSCADMLYALSCLIDE